LINESGATLFAPLGGKAIYPLLGVISIPPPPGVDFYFDKSVLINCRKIFIGNSDLTYQSFKHIVLSTN